MWNSALLKTEHASSAKTLPWINKEKKISEPDEARDEDGDAKLEDGETGTGRIRRKICHGWFWDWDLLHAVCCCHAASLAVRRERRNSSRREALNNKSQKNRAPTEDCSKTQHWEHTSHDTDIMNIMLMSLQLAYTVAYMLTSSLWLGRILLGIHVCWTDYWVFKINLTGCLFKLSQKRAPFLSPSLYITNCVIQNPGRVSLVGKEPKMNLT